MAVLRRARRLVVVSTSAFVIAAFSACTSFRQHGDYWTDGGADSCLDGSCLVKKPDGEPCSAATECMAGVCGGRCCAAGCTCTLPSPENLLKDPGIDVDVVNWTTNLGTIARSLFDAESCPYSGSLATTGDAQQRITQCVRNTPLAGDFNFGARFKYESNGSAPTTPLCQASFYSGFNCDADLVIQNETASPAQVGTWWALSAALPGVSGANSVGLTCYLSPSSGVTYYLDMFYVSKAPSSF